MKWNKDTKITLVFWVVYSSFSLIITKDILKSIFFLLIGTVLVFVFMLRNFIFKRKARAVINEEEVPEPPKLLPELPLLNNFDNVFKEDFGVRDVD